jgi:CO/xanthine dehydrogenase Mo-binding subunit
VIGTHQLRRDARAKVDGFLRFTADIAYPDLLHGRVVRSPLAHGRLRAIRRGRGVDGSRIVFATAEEIHGNRFVHMIADDMPFLA